jgi:hypothetical protein
MSTPDDEKYDPLAEYDDSAGSPLLGNGLMWLGFVLGGSGVLAGVAGLAILIGRDGPNWRGAFIGCAVMLAIGGATWFAGTLFGGEAWHMIAFFVGALLGLFRGAGIFLTGLGAISLVGGGPPGEAIPILAGGLAILGLSYGAPKLADRRAGRIR